VKLQSRVDYDALVRSDGVHSRVYTDPGIFTDEMVRIFHDGWVYVGHVGEVPEVGDYRLKRIGLAPVIMVRGLDGKVRLLLNRCRHRGATLCQSERGHVRALRCSYHGWTYRLDGTLSGVPYPGGYDEAFRKEDFGLTQAPRIGTYRGFVFGSLSATGITLDEHLGRARRELDLFAGLSDDDEIGVTAGAQKYDYGCNWKLQIENALDGYHPSFVHSTFIDAVVQRRKNPSTGYQIDYDPNAFTAGGGVTRDLGGGHVMMDYGFRIYDTLSADVPPQVHTTTDSGARHMAELERQLGSAHAADGLRAGATHTLIFPNLVLIGVHIRTVMPLSVDRTEVTLQPVTLRWLPDEVNAIRIRCHEAFYGSASFGAPDDIEIFERIGRGLAASSADQWQPIARGINHPRSDEEGLPIADIADEMTNRAIWRQWKKVMTAGDHPKIEGRSVQRSRRRTFTRS